MSEKYYTPGSASTKDGTALVSLTNVSEDAALDVSIDLRGRAATVRRARVLTADSAADFNEPSAPNRVAPTELTVSIENGVLTATLPAHSFATVELDLAEIGRPSGSSLSRPHLRVARQ